MMYLLRLLFVAVMFLLRIIWFLLVLAALAAAVLFLYRKLFPKKTRAEMTPPVSQAPDLPVPFGYKTAWLAIPDTAPEAVISALELTGPVPANWESGLTTVRSGRLRQVFVSPSVKGFVLVIGIDNGLSDLTEPDAVDALAAQLPSFQFFASHRTVDLFVWGQYRDGKSLRRYGWLGESGQVLFCDGTMTPEEAKLGFAELPSGTDFDWAQVTLPDESRVTDLAAAWGVDPLFREKSGLTPGTGFLCGWETHE